MKNKNINAFNKKVTREQAYQIIINDFITYIVYARNTDGLEDILLDGWKSLESWTDAELEEFISNLCIENQPGGKI